MAPQDPRLKARDSSCDGTGGDPALAMRLPVLGGGDPARVKIRKSGASRWRAVVLFTIQVLMIVHLIQWMITGNTLTPVEPSESMEFTKRGVINAGLIFFVLALLATLIFGRWFCGWGCHIIMLQDFCGWIMKRMGVRPRAFRSRLLLWVPLILAVYMFLWPLIYRLAIAPFVQPDLQPITIEPHLMTEDYWQSFAGIAVAIPFFLICGFATVYFLGAKAFCTYGCPYGGFFAPLDKVAIGSIRVTDACEGCGHCTAVCTSNVRVHDEVREYGMVVDQGCMKCMDCVSVCPNDALYFGFGKPSMLKGPAKSRKPAPRFDLTWPEEIAFAAIFAGAFFAVRSVYGLVPMLMAGGAAMCTTFIAWKMWRLVRDENVSFHHARLKYRGRIGRAGWGWVAMGTFVMLAVAHCGVVRSAYAMAQSDARKAARPPEAVYAPAPSPISAEQAEHAERALRIYRFVSEIGAGGISLPIGWQGSLDIAIARLEADQLDFAAAERTLRRSEARDGRSEHVAASLAWVLRAQGRDGEAMELYREVLFDEAGYHGMLVDLVDWSRQVGVEPVAEILAARYDSFPDDLPTVQWLAVMRLNMGRPEEAVTLIRHAIELNPEDADAWRTLAGVLRSMRRNAEADEAQAEVDRLTAGDGE